MTQGKEVKGTHPDIKRSHGISNLTVRDQPVESLENHKSSLEEMTDELGIQIRTARVGHYSCSDMNQSEEVENKHLNTEKPLGGSDLSVEDHPVDSLENHNSSHEVTTDQLGIQTRTGGVEHYSWSEDNNKAISIVCDTQEIVDNEEDTQNSTGIDDKLEVETGSVLQGNDRFHSETSHLEEICKFKLQDSCSPTIHV